MNYGTTIKYPIELDHRGHPVTIGYIEAIEQSITFLLFTSLGEMLFLRDVGTTIKALIWKTNDVEKITTACVQSSRLIELNEKRIEKVIVKLLDRTQDTIKIHVGYSIRATGQEQFLVIPFKKQTEN